MTTQISIDVELKRALLEHLGQEGYCTLLRRRSGKPNAPTVLASISTQTLPINVSRLIKKFLKDLSIKAASAYINKINANGENILFFCKDIDLMSDIIKYVHNIDKRDKNGNTALITMCDRDCTISRLNETENNEPRNIKIIELLLDNGADINAANKDGETILMRYCTEYSPSSECLAGHFELGADAKTTFSRFYLGPIQTDANNNFERGVEMLVRKDANVFAVTNLGLPAVDLVYDPAFLSADLLRLLKGEISMSGIKSALKI